MYTVYGIKNCNTVKKALDFLDRHEIPYEFHDYKKQGITKAKLSEWAAQLGWEPLINKKGMTWRGLDEDVKTGVTNKKAAIALAQEKTSMIKRPLIERGGKVIALGFDQSLYDDTKWVK